MVGPVPGPAGIAGGHSSVAGRLLLPLLAAAPVLRCAAPAADRLALHGSWKSLTEAPFCGQFPCMQASKIAPHASQDIGLGPSLLVAFLAGSGNVLITNPIWTIATRMQVHAFLLGRCSAHARCPGLSSTLNHLVSHALVKVSYTAAIEYPAQPCPASLALSASGRIFLVAGQCD